MRRASKFAISFGSCSFEEPISDLQRPRVVMTISDQNLPYGVFRRRAGTSRSVWRLGDRILDLRRGAAAGLFDSLPPETRRACSADTLNALMALDSASLARTARAP